ncbi:hypothetical protein NE237_006047 [Protea cynaroides]|uniref:AT3G52170-like helix-turn-helix domain-containing protein n=1 Tax=Protea cynaroides TaxID=273540 RepID=A0A9Q0KLI2_9MAGN|nr:hypothetical protein NE237_006047 [Protea cynaroides]
MQVARGVTLSSRNSTFRLADSKRVFTKIYDYVHGQNIQCHGRTSAAAVPSKASEPLRHQRRLSKDERRAMVITFVDKYRADNSGKFPTPTFAQKNLGGSYYALRQIIQELEYKSNSPPTNRTEESIPRKEVEAASQESLTEVEEDSESKMGCTSSEQLGMDENVQTMINTMKDGVSTTHFEAEEGPQVSTRFEEILSVENIKLKIEEVIHTHSEKHEDSEKEGNATKGLQDSNGPRGVVQETVEALDTDKFERDIIRKENEEDQLQNRSAIWRNLKSFADGFMNLWRKKSSLSLIDRIQPPDDLNPLAPKWRKFIFHKEQVFTSSSSCILDLCSTLCLVFHQGKESVHLPRGNVGGALSPDGTLES